ncbi:hypothetical protein ACOSQ3_002087 [Xanthoceras sorbifolium]
MGRLQFIVRVPTLYDDFLTRGLSHRIEEEQKEELRHILLRYTLMFACLTHKDLLEIERSEAEKRELREELEAARRELTEKMELEK